VSSVDDAMEVLTGVPAGERQVDGKYPEGTVHYLVDERLHEMGEAMRQFGRKPKDETATEKSEGEETSEEPADIEEPAPKKPRRRKPPQQ